MDNTLSGSKIFTISLCLLASYVSASLVIYPPSPQAGSHPVIGQDIGRYTNLYQPINVTIVNEQRDFLGLAVIIDMVNIKTSVRGSRLEDLQKRGAEMIIVAIGDDSIPQELFAYSIDNPRRYDINLHIPIFTVDKNDLSPDMLNSSTQWQGIISSDFNAYYATVNHWGFYVAYGITIFVTLIAFSLCSVKLCRLIIEERCLNLRLSLVCLAMMVAANFLRFMFLIDPARSFQLIPVSIVFTLQNSSLPITVSVMLLITMYWHETLQGKSVIASAFLMSMKLPFLISVVVVNGLEFVAGMLRIFVSGSTLTTIVEILSWLVIFATSISTLTYSSIISWRLYVVLKKRMVNNKDQKWLNLVKIRIIVANALLTLLLLTIAVIAIVVSAGPSFLVYMAFLYILLLDGLSITQALAFAKPSTPKSRTSGRRRPSQHATTSSSNKMTTAHTTASTATISTHGTPPITPIVTTKRELNSKQTLSLATVVVNDTNDDD